MLVPLIGWFIALSNADGLFNRSPAFASLHQYAGEKTWALVCLSVFLVRAFSLVINGTFTQFVYSPHLRGLAAIIAGWFWALVAFGTFFAMLEGRSIGTAFFAYSTFTIFEIVNVFRAAADTGPTERMKHRVVKNVRPDH
ncbi:MAG: hypothetical protein ACSHXI_06925 [Hoeflea sp.]|uniref:hypothetical protein n=1 Tax=Hoeflea sp. TaxID=1940281 RepID=UPI003EF70E77